MCEEVRGGEEGELRRGGTEGVEREGRRVGREEW